MGWVALCYAVVVVALGGYALRLRRETRQIEASLGEDPLHG
jgi:hypothetical protein